MATTAKLSLVGIFLYACLFQSVVSAEQTWAKDFVFGTDAQRRELKSKIVEENGFSKCTGVPGSHESKDNLAARFMSSPFQGWEGHGLENKRSEDGYEFVSFANFEDKDHGPELNFGQLTPGHYEFSVWARLEGTSEESPLFAHARSPSHNSTDERVIASGVARRGCWSKLVGGMSVLSPQHVVVRLSVASLGAGLHLANIFVRGQDQTTYLQNQAALINKLRKRQVRLHILDGYGRPFNGFVEIDQTQNLFGFGGSVSQNLVNNDVYQQWFKTNFNWAVMEISVQWYLTEKSPGVYSYDIADALTGLLQSMDINIRGHSVHEDNPNLQPPWFKSLRGAAMDAAMRRRVSDVVTRYRGRFAHWDCLNEFFRFSYFENVTGNPTIAAEVFKQAKQVDPKMLAFANDYNIIEAYSFDPYAPVRYIAKIEAVEARGGPVDRIGAEGHFGAADGPAIRYELDLLAAAGKPVWITELEVFEKNPLLQADLFEIIMREAFSHPSVEGIVLWVPSPIGCTANTCLLALVDNNFVDRPIGTRFRKLRKEWSTHRHQWTKNGVVNFKGFFGDYVLRSRINGKVVQSTFSVSKGSTPVDITIHLPK